MFDESFVRAARIQEFSARERLDGTARSVRIRRIWSRGGAPRQAMVLIALILLAFGTAIYLGIRNPYQRPPEPAAQPLRISLIPLTPSQAVPVVDRGHPYDGQRAAEYQSGAEGITLPPAHRTGGFAESQVMQALTTAKDYLVASSLDPEALTGGAVRKVRDLLAPGQVSQFDHSLSAPADDGRHAATGWLVRFDPARVELADDQVRVRGTMSVAEAGTGVLEVVTDHTLVYAVRDATKGASARGGDSGGATSLFTVRRELRLRFDHDDLRDHHVEVMQAIVEAGPLSCAVAPVPYFRPLLAGQRPQSMSRVDPYDHDHQITSVCGLLSPAVSAGPPGHLQVSPAASRLEADGRPGSSGPSSASAPRSR